MGVSDLHPLAGLDSSTSPDRVFIYAWAADLLQRAMADVEAECRADGKGVHWEVFHERVARPILEERDSPDLAEVCARFGIEDEKTASNMLITVKRRFRATVRRLLAETLSSGQDVEEELNDLVAILIDPDGAA